MKYYSVVVGDDGGYEVSNLKESRQLAQALAEKTGKTVRIFVHEGPWVAPYVLEEFKCCQ
jgi:sulfur relay (sulfurtransferase) complex TusBCD TusD component (DsrE family)